ncbi:hypothetical protein [Wohlfahrtiimonas populi]|uniref:hypothetical protein n=1 Tax=Wohlfahrtiimonas populi TaxID=1940240 RepID=UPI001E4C1B9D|nr:hypothetical protein [Wohlfahrtiimonas populi]
MNFSIAVVSKNRSHTKAFKRVMVNLQPLIDALENIEVKCPIGDSVLIMASDEDNLKPFEIVEIPNKDALFQYAAGIKEYVSDAELKMDLFLILRLIVKKVPFATTDHEQYENIFQTMASKFIVS